MRIALQVSTGKSWDDEPAKLYTVENWAEGVTVAKQLSASNGNAEVRMTSPGDSYEGSFQEYVGRLSGAYINAGRSGL